MTIRFDSKGDIQFGIASVKEQKKHWLKSLVAFLGSEEDNQEKAVEETTLKFQRLRSVKDDVSEGNMTIILEDQQTMAVKVRMAEAEGPPSMDRIDHKSMFS